jgi:hypothetical protein
MSSLTFRQWLRLISEGVDEIKAYMQQVFTSRGAPPPVFEEIWDELVSQHGWAINRPISDQEKADMLLRQSDVSAMAKLIWTPQPVVLQLAPGDLTRNSLNYMRETEFGDSPHPDVENSPHRVQRARDYVQRPVEEVEPVVLIFEGGKYRIFAGHHRMAAWFLTKAPADRDIKKWPRVNVIAYVGKYH